jgi:hypothetical protein
MNFFRGSWKLLILVQGSFGHSPRVGGAGPRPAAASQAARRQTSQSSRPSGSATRGTPLHFVQWARRHTQFNPYTESRTQR